MDVSAEDQFKRLRGQIADTQEQLYTYWLYLSRRPRDQAVQTLYAKMIKDHQSLRDEVDVLFPPFEPRKTLYLE